MSLTFALKVPILVGRLRCREERTIALLSPQMHADLRLRSSSVIVIVGLASFWSKLLTPKSVAIRFTRQPCCAFRHEQVFTTPSQESHLDFVSARVHGTAYNTHEKNVNAVARTSRLY